MYSCWSGVGERSSSQFNISKFLSITAYRFLKMMGSRWAPPSNSGEIFLTIQPRKQKESSVHQSIKPPSIIHGRVGQLTLHSCSKFQFGRLVSVHFNTCNCCRVLQNKCIISCHCWLLGDIQQHEVCLSLSRNKWWPGFKLSHIPAKQYTEIRF